MAGNVRFEEAVWSVTRQPAVSVGARAPGDAPPLPVSGGLLFESDKGESRFLGISPVPTEAELQDIDTFIGYLKRAERR